MEQNSLKKKKKRKEKVKPVVKELGSTDNSQHVSFRSNSVYVKSGVHAHYTYILYVGQVVFNLMTQVCLVF